MATWDNFNRNAKELQDLMFQLWRQGPGLKNEGGFRKEHQQKLYDALCNYEQVEREVKDE